MKKRSGIIILLISFLFIAAEVLAFMIFIRPGMKMEEFYDEAVKGNFEGMNRIEDVEKLRGCSLLVERKDAIPLEEGEYYVADLIGISVRTQDGREIGTLREVVLNYINIVIAVSFVAIAARCG